MRWQHILVVAVFALLVPPLAMAAFEIQFRAYSSLSWSLSQHFGLDYSLGARPPRTLDPAVRVAIPSLLWFALPALVTGVVVAHRANATGNPVTERSGFDIGAWASLFPVAVILVLGGPAALAALWTPWSFWLMLLVFSTLSMAIAAAICTWITRPWQ